MMRTFEKSLYLLFFVISVNSVGGPARYLTYSTENILKLHTTLHLHKTVLGWISFSSNFSKYFFTFFNFFFWLPAPSPPEKLDTWPTLRRMNEHLEAKKVSKTVQFCETNM